MMNLIDFIWIWDEIQGLKVPKHHVLISEFLEKQWNKKEKNTLLMAFRNSGKSTIVGLFCAWILYRYPDTRILVLSADYELSKKMVRNIKRIIEKHPLCIGMKPDEKDQWASDRFTIKRLMELRDPSVMGRGLGANITGARADLVICDDVEVPKTSATQAKRNDLRAKLSELDFVLVPGGMMLFVGTPHTFDTIYDTDGFLRGFKSLKIPIFNQMGQSWWPERFDLEKIEKIRLRSGEAKFKSQMLLEATHMTLPRLDVSKLKKYTSPIEYIETNRTSELKINGCKMVGVQAWWDPAFGKKEKGDYSVVACVFSDDDGRYFLHEISYLEIDDIAQSAQRQCRMVVEFIKRNYIPQISIEVNGIGRFLPELLRNEIRKNGIVCAVKEEHSRSCKEVRITDAFDAILSQGALWVHESVYQTKFIEEMQEWIPVNNSSHDDGLDAVAGCLLSGIVRFKKTSLTKQNKIDWRYGALNPTLSLDDVKI